MTLRRALLIINPNSRNGRSDIGPALDVLRQGGIDLFRPDGEGSSDRGTDSRWGDLDMIIVGGGDGTLNRVIDEVLKQELPLGILPLGTANDLARTLGLPEDLRACADIIVRGGTKKIDLGKANDKHFFNVASLGVSGEVAKELNKDLKARFGVLGYAIGLWRAVAKRRVINGSIRCDGRSMKLRAIQISIGNGRFYGGGMTISADADIDDGKLDLVLVAPQTIWQLLRSLPLFRWGHHDLNDNVRHLSCREIELSTRIALSVNTDGEMTTQTPANFRLVPAALEVFVPSSGLAEAFKDRVRVSSE